MYQITDRDSVFPVLKETLIPPSVTIAIIIKKQANTIQSVNQCRNVFPEWLATPSKGSDGKLPGKSPWIIMHVPLNESAELSCTSNQ